MLLLALLIIYLILKQHEDTVKRYSYTIIIWVSFLYLLTETLSLFQKVNRVGLICGWGIFLLVLIGAVFVLQKKNFNMFSYKKGTVILLIKKYPIHILVCVITFLWALGTIPHNWDSMTYQLTRVMHWVQNGSIAHFATNNTRQVASPTLSAFINLHIYILSGEKDFLFNLLQWACYVTNAWFVYKIAIKIGCKSKFAGLSSLLFLSMPIAFAEALTTQVDHFATLWLLIFTYFLLDFLTEKKIEFCKDTVLNCVVLSACVAYGYMTKPTVSIAMLLMVMALLVVCIVRRDSFVHLFKLLAIVIPVMAILILPEIVRNISTFGAINPPNVGQRQLVGTLKPNYVFVNFLKNFTFNIPNIFLYRSDRIVKMIVVAAASVLGVELNHPSISEDGRDFMVHAAQNYGHDTAVNPVILILSIVCVAWCLYRTFKKHGKCVAITCYAFVMFCVFCCVLRWEPYVSRYMLPYLAIMCPVIGVQVQDMSDNCKWNMVKNFIYPCVVCVCLVDIFAMTWYHGGIMKGSWTNRNYVNRMEIAEEYREAMVYIKDHGYKEVGLMFITDDGEYPLWELAEDGIWIEHLSANNDTIKYERDEYVPDCILKTYDSDESLIYNDVVYERMQICGKHEYLWIYARKLTP